MFSSAEIVLATASATDLEGKYKNFIDVCLYQQQVARGQVNRYLKIGFDESLFMYSATHSEDRIHQQTSCLCRGTLNRSFN